MLKKLTIYSLGLFPLLYLLAFRQPRLFWFYLITIAVFYLMHGYFRATFFSHSYLLLPLLGALGGLLYAYYPPNKYKIIVSAAAIAVSLAYTTDAVPIKKQNYEHRHFYNLMYQDPKLRIAKTLADLPPEQVKAVIWVHFDSWSTGAYYYFHHPVPMYYNSFAFAERHQKIIYHETIPIAQLASHIVTLETDRPEGFKILQKFPAELYGAPADVVILENVTDNAIIIPEPYLLNKPSNIDDYLEQHMADERRPFEYLPAAAANN